MATLQTAAQTETQPTNRIIYYPALNEEGWVESVEKKLDALLADFYMAEYSQDTVFYKSISSLPWILQRNNGDMTETAIAIRSQLQTYLMKYFETVYVECEPVPTDSDMKGVISLLVDVAANGESIRLRNLLRIQGTRLMDVKKALE